MLKITGLKLPLGFREGDLKRAAAKQLRLPESAIGQVRLCKKSVDARKKDNVHFVCAVEAAIQGDENRLLSRRQVRMLASWPERSTSGTSRPS